MTALEVMFDLDGVAYDIITPMMKIVPERFNRPLETSACLEKVFGSGDNLLEFMVENRILEIAPVYEGVVEAMKRIAEKHDIIVVSARDFHPEGYEVTRDSLARNGIPFRELHVTYPGRPKSELYSQWGKRFAAMIEDTPSNLDDAHNSGLFDRVFCRSQTWNKGYNKGHMVSCVSEVADMLVGPRLEMGRG